MLLIVLVWMDTMMMESIQLVLFAQTNVINVQMKIHVLFVLLTEKLEVNQAVHVQMVNLKKKEHVMIVISNVQLVNLKLEIV